MTGIQRLLPGIKRLLPSPVGDGGYCTVRNKADDRDTEAANRDTEAATKRCG